MLKGFSAFALSSMFSTLEPDHGELVGERLERARRCRDALFSQDRVNFTNSALPPVTGTSSGLKP